MDKCTVIEDIKKNISEFFFLIKPFFNNLKYPDHLTIPQLMFLSELKHNGSCTVSELAKNMVITSAAVSSLSNKLLDNGLITRYRPKNNRRIVILDLTDKGDEILEQSHKAKLMFLGEFLNTLEPEDLEEINSCFYKINTKFKSYKK